MWKSAEQCQGMSVTTVQYAKIVSHVIIHRHYFELFT